jgi:hypothetical protein
MLLVGKLTGGAKAGADMLIIGFEEKWPVLRVLAAVSRP